MGLYKCYVYHLLTYGLITLRDNGDGNSELHKAFAILCCSQTAEYDKCVEQINCTSSVDTYRWYLMWLGIAEAYNYICDAEVLPGLWA